MHNEPFGEKMNQVEKLVQRKREERLKYMRESFTGKTTEPKPNVRKGLSVDTNGNLTEKK